MISKILQETMGEITGKICVLFGGNGFIGSQLAATFLESNYVSKIVIADIATATPDKWPKSLQLAFAAGQIDYIKLDVRKPINEQNGLTKLPSTVDLIVNLAAVHKEPGHKANEYFETNIPGAENVCAWAEQVNCNSIIFTSSIAVYDGKLGLKTELSPTMPLSPYGVSKLVAEKIHKTWQRAGLNSDGNVKKLLIVRPGVIFGPGEKGNVTRMVRAIMRHYFVFVGNKNVQKAGGYVKELCNSILFMHKWQEENNEPEVLYNFTTDPAPTVNDYAQGIIKIAGVKRFIPNIPYRIVLLGSYFFHFIASLLGRKEAISPTTVRKTLKYNAIAPEVLEKLHYQYTYTLEDGLADWYKERPQEW